MHLNTIGERIQQELDQDPKKSATACAEYAGLSKSTLSELIKGRSKSSTKLHLIAEYLGVRVRWLETGKGPKYATGQAESISEGPTTYTVVRKVPVSGTASAGLDGFWTDLDYPPGEGDGYFLRACDDPDAYALKIKGMSMFPAIRPGWYIEVKPNKSTHVGEFVLMRLRDGRSTVKELLWHRGGEWALNAVGDGTRLVVPEADVEFVHAVSGVLPPSERME